MGFKRKRVLKSVEWLPTSAIEIIRNANAIDDLLHFQNEMRTKKCVIVRVTSKIDVEKLEKFFDTTKPENVTVIASVFSASTLVEIESARKTFSIELYFMQFINGDHECTHWKKTENECDWCTSNKEKIRYLFSGIPNNTKVVVSLDYESSDEIVLIASNCGKTVHVMSQSDHFLCSPLKGLIKEVCIGNLERCYRIPQPWFIEEAVKERTIQILTTKIPGGIENYTNFFEYTKKNGILFSRKSDIYVFIRRDAYNVITTQKFSDISINTFL